MPGTKKSWARPVNSARPAPSPMPSRPPTAWVTGSRLTSRQIVKTAAGTRAASTDLCTSCVKAQTTEKTAIGRIDSARPRGPPITDCSESWSAIACPRPSCAAGPRARSSSGMRLRHELVTRVEHGAMPLRLGDHAVDPQPPAGFDAGDVPAPEPHDVQAPAAVVQLRLERGHPGPGAQRDGAERAADGGLPAGGEHGDRGSAGPGREFLLVFGVDLVLGGHQAGQGLPPAWPLFAAHASRVRGGGRAGARPHGDRHSAHRIATHRISVI